MAQTPTNSKTKRRGRGRSRAVVIFALLGVLPAEAVGPVEVAREEVRVVALGYIDLKGVSRVALLPH